MMLVTTAHSWIRPVMTCLPPLFHVLPTCSSLRHDKSLLTQEITRVPLMSAPRWMGADVLARYASIPGAGR
jgi:hypothetical protein